MATCSKCGADSEGKFCQQCGAPLGESEGATQPTPPPPAQPPPSAAGSGMTDNVAGTLCYVLGFITGIIFLVLEPYSKNKAVRFHAFQSIFVSVALFVIWIAISAVLPWGVYLLISPLLSLGQLGLWIFLLWKTYQKQKVVLPVIGEMAEKQA